MGPSAEVVITFWFLCFCAHTPLPLQNVFQNTLLLCPADSSWKDAVRGRFWRVGWPSCLLPNLWVTSNSGIWLLKREMEEESTAYQSGKSTRPQERVGHLEWSSEDLGRGSVRIHPGLVSWGRWARDLWTRIWKYDSLLGESFTFFFFFFLVSIYSKKIYLYLLASQLWFEDKSVFVKQS